MTEEINATAIVMETATNLRKIEDHLRRLTTELQDGIKASRGFDGVYRVSTPVHRGGLEWSDVTMIYAEGRTLASAFRNLSQLLIKLFEQYPPKDHYRVKEQA